MELLHLLSLKKGRTGTCLRELVDPAAQESAADVQVPWKHWQEGIVLFLLIQVVVLLLVWRFALSFQS